MANYVKATNFAVKDGLGTSDPAKIIKGTEIDNEYNAIASAVSSKADSNSPTLTGTPLAPTAASGTNTTQIATTAFVQAAAGNSTNIVGGGANRVVYQTATDTTGFAAAPTVAGTYLGWTGSAFAWSTVSASTSAALTMNNSGAGDSSGATFNGSIAKTISYNTIGAPSASGTGATGTWGINITGSSGSTASVTNGVYTVGDQTIAGAKTFSSPVRAPSFNLAAFTSYYISGSAAYFSVSTTTTNNVLVLEETAVKVGSGVSLLSAGDNTSSLGTASFRWSTVYAATGTINTSDRDEKTQINELNAAEKLVAGRIKLLVKKFKFKDAVAIKGDNARIHVGFIAQEVRDAFIAEGLDPTKYSLFCYDEWTAKEATFGQNGSVGTPAIAAGSRYGIRYDELLAFLISAL